MRDTLRDRERASRGLAPWYRKPASRAASASRPTGLARGVPVVVRSALLVATALAWGGCGGSGSKKGAVSPHDARASTCQVNQTREFFCDDLLPLSAALPAPAPYETCPSSIETAVGQYDPPPSVALFDASYTEYTRKRAPPGHSCCYSWCSTFKVADPRAPSAQTSCTTAAAFREEYCMNEPEQGSSAAGPSPYGKCAIAIVPPAKAVFSVPESALFDSNATAAHRSKGQMDCCYAWCSQAPPGSGLQKKK